jgi:hypothetical protein
MFAHMVSNMISLIFHHTQEEMPLFIFKLYIPGSKLVVYHGSRQKALFSDELSDVPSDIFSDRNTDSGDEKKKKNFGHRK